MIIGNPGIYDSEGCFSNFAIQIDRILNTDNFSINLCIDMSIFPSHLPYNKASYLIEFFDPKLDIFSVVNDELFSLPDRALMRELMKKGFAFIYSIEQLIKNNEIDGKLFIEDEEILFDKLDRVGQTESINPYLWEIDYMEYINMGYYPFIVNSSKGFSKVVIIFNKRRNYDIDYIEDRLLFSEYLPKDNIGFFDNDFWGVKISCIKTDDLHLIISKIYSLLNQFVND